MTPLSFYNIPAFAKTQEEALREMLNIQAQTISFGESLKHLNDRDLNSRAVEGKWSALECLEHLNRYAAHYLPLLSKQANQAPARKNEAYKPGLLGKPFAIAMHPAKRAKTMSSPKNMNPIGSVLKASVLDQFIEYQREFQQILTSLSDLSLRGSRVPISIVPIVKLHLGDMLYTLVWHNARHSLQAEEALKTINVS